MIYTHVLKVADNATRSALDLLAVMSALGRKRKSEHLSSCEWGGQGTAQGKSCIACAWTGRDVSERAWLHSRGFAVESLFPVPRATDVGVGLLLYIGATLYAVSAKGLLAVPGQVEPIDRMVASARISLPTLIASSVINGAYEEVFLLGCLVRELRGYGLTLAIGASLFVRLLYHTYQGPLAALSVLIFGAVLTLYFIESGKLFPAVLAHAIADVVPFVWR